MLLKLPSRSSEQGRASKQWPIIGDFFSFLPPGVEFTFDNMKQNICKELTNYMHNQLPKEDGLIVAWFINPSVPIQAEAVLIPKDIELIRELLSSRMLSALQKGVPYKISEPLLGESVLATSGAKWAKQRAVLDHGFVPTIMVRTWRRHELNNIVFNRSYSFLLLCKL